MASVKVRSIVWPHVKIRYSVWPWEKGWILNLDILKKTFLPAGVAPLFLFDLYWFLMACQPAYGYFMPKGYGILFIVVSSFMFFV